ncbi:hypothetical protein ES703_62194 [subsurface metagenome]
MVMATVPTDANGTFESTFNVPVSKSGNRIITVSDEVSTKYLAFTVETDAPAKPVLLLPASASAVKAEAYFYWQNVYDSSPPVTYSLQVASDGNFASMVLEKEGLTGSEYALTGDERLAAVKREAPYYWRVKAIDGADNEGEWSSARLFYVAVPAKPVLLLPASATAAKAEAYFDWGDVTSLSPPVTYSLQVASGSDFASIVLEKEGLTGSEYAMTGDEKLAAVKREAPYYWRVKAIDGADNEGEWSSARSFYVAAPSSPVLLLPETGIKADAGVYFDWGDVTSLSPPVTYNLQVAPDSNFASIVLEKEGLSGSEYTQTEEEELPAVKKEAPYYWRVKAIDADNEGEWSAPGSFYIGYAMPGWAIYILIGLAVLLVILLAFWMGRRTAYYSET